MTGTAGTAGTAGAETLRGLLGLALRRNPKRAHLLVSQVLGKHVPQRPDVVHEAGLGLGRRVRRLLGEEAAARAVVLGYAETATGLGHSVADGLGPAAYLHSTRRPVRGIAPVGGFEEEHSHASSHLLLPEDPDLLGGDGPLVLVDDEFSTGRTVLNTVRALHERFPRDRYVIVALVDLRTGEHRDALRKAAADLGARVDLVALASGTVRLPEDVLERGQALVARYEAVAGAEAGAGAVAGAGAPSGAGSPPAAVRRVELGWPHGLPDGGRHGFLPGHRARLEAALPEMAGRIAEALTTDGAAVAPVPEPGAAEPGPASVPGPAASVPGPAASVPGPASVPEHAADRPGRAEPGAPGRVLVLGCEELMYAPLRLAQALQRALGERAEVRYSTTTRSPVLAVDDPGYAIRTRIAFPAHDAPADGPGERYAYNVAPGADPARRFDAVVTVVDSAADTVELHAPGGLLSELARHTDRVLLAVVPSHVPSPRAGRTGPTGRTGRKEGAAGPGPAAAPDTGPAAQAAPVSAEAGPGAVPPPRGPAPAALPGPLRGPAFSSYRPDEVGWLLQDLSAVPLEAPVEEREEAVQRGGAHYAESLPVEYQPSEDYQRLFRTALDTSAARIARAVGTVTETLLAERAGRGTGRPVLVSLARAGTPVGILMRRWALHAHGLDLPHYAVSIVRGRGIDTTALRWLAEHHDPADAVFVDGWTGKGAITRELAAAIEDFTRTTGITGFDPEIAVLADPGGCVRTYGTREDFLIPSACLNSTVSGLVSRTVLRADLVGPDDFHGAKFYRELAGSDVSGHFLDAVSARFGEVAERAAADAAELLSDTGRAPTWEGWAAVERISEQYGIHDVNLVKPGVGETTRVLLRRVPWRVLARRGAGADLDHIRLLAEQRGVPVEEVGELPYSCVGLIHPRYTRGATGADGKAVISA
ncbi:phosphoribosyltransferase domain-containing protein [Streptomyces sp. S07_1.15]|uniref:phosphoribosyltransferase n=1 Tax=Streptomyces sp. S07_1.15 TaxID=2873925 RepID=UPI001D1425C3|nr:phosphoribosyltransferase [Streptomyces sp. S07_1.15]MCC3654320.1 phosphoribosyltransferase domain-containing protein [Streptomyces sp. S07_1.15]